MENEQFYAIAGEGLRTVANQLRGFKSAKIEIEQTCDCCFGEGHTIPHANNLHLHKMENNEIPPIPCFKCGGSGGIDVVIDVTVTKTAVKKSNKK